MSKVGEMNRTMSLFPLIFGGVLLTYTIGCSSQARKTALVPTEAQQDAAAQANRDQPLVEPTSLETFSAFLDRG
jgi:hypothetical protein